MEPGLIELLIFLPAIVFLGIKTSYDDIKTGKIKNKFIIFAIAYALIAYILLITFLISRGLLVNYSYLKDISVNVILALFIGYVLWHTKLWSAADAKLFVAFTVLVPLSIYSNTYYRFFPSLVLLINTFAPFLLYSPFRLIFFTTKKKRKETIKRIRVKEFYRVVLNLFWVSGIFRLFNILNIKFDFLVGFTFIFIFLILLEKIFKERLLMVSLVLCVLRLILDYRYVLTFLFLKQFVILLLVLTIIFFIMKIAFVAYTKTIKISFLKEGMILAERIYKEKNSKKYKKALPDEIKSAVKRGHELLILEEPAEGLTYKDVKRIQKLYKEKKLAFTKIKIQQTLPFAPFMFVGVLLTIMARGNFLILLKILTVKFISLSV